MKATWNTTAIAACAALSFAGCGSDQSAEKPKQAAKPAEPLPELGPPQPPPKDPNKPVNVFKAHARPILDLARLKPGTYRIIKPKTDASAGLRLDSSMYTGPAGTLSVAVTRHAIDIWHAQHDRWPKDANEFYEGVIKPNRLTKMLPRLPHYMRFAYDQKNHCLVVVEFPDQKPK